MNLREQLAGLELQKSGILAEVRGWPEQLRAARPMDGGWSALQVLDHLVRTESGICEVMAQGANEPRRIGVRDRVGFALVERVFRSRRRVRVPRSVEDIVWPGEELDFREVERRWDSVRSELAGVVEPRTGCSGGVFRHPVSGWMTLEQVLRFFSVHMVHHEFQLERIREELEATSRWR